MTEKKATNRRIQSNDTVTCMEGSFEGNVSEVVTIDDSGSAFSDGYAGIYIDQQTNGI